MITIYSILTSVLIVSILFILFTFVENSDFIIKNVSLILIQIFLILILLRTYLPIEIENYTIFVNLFIFFSKIESVLFYNFLRTSNNLNITTANIFFVVWIVKFTQNTFSFFHRYIKIICVIKSIPETKNEQVLTILEELKLNYKFKHKIKIIIDKNIDVPQEMGIFRQTIFLPKENYSDEKLRYILLHELYHYKNLSNIIKFVVVSLKSIFWWNPLYFNFVKAVNAIMEINCDNFIARRTNRQEKFKYIECILDVSKTASDHIDNEFATFMSNSKTEVFLKRRFNLILYKEKDSKIFNIIFSLLLAVLFLLSYKIVLQKGVSH